MRVNHWLIGCAICFAGIGGAAATTADNREMENSQHGNGDTGGARDFIIGSEPGLTRDSTPRSSSSDSHKSASNGSGADRSGGGGDTAPPGRAKQSHLGWQSLLPGSIQ